MGIDIIGNGSSNTVFTKSSGYVIGCNVPTHGIPVNALSIIDNQPITWMRNNNWEPRVPVFCTPSVKDYAIKKNLSGDWHPVYEKRERYNAGLHATEYATRLSKKIHLWGFDSLFSDDLTSQMDALVPRNSRPPLNKWWRPHWQALFDANPTVDFVIHIPQGKTCDKFAENVHIQAHSTDSGK